MSWRILLPAGLAALLIGLVIYLPASLVAGWAQDRVPGLRLAGISGSALDGRAQQVLFRNATLKNVAWQLHPGALLLGRLSTTLTMATDSGDLRANASFGLFGGAHLANARGNASLAGLAALAGYNFVPLGGSLQIRDGAVSFDGETVQSASGRLQLSSAEWLLLRPPLALGDFTAEVDSKQGNTTLDIVNSDGPLAIEGQAGIGPNGVYTLDIRLRARAGADERLKNLLDQLGKPDTEGWYRIKERGRL